MHQKIDYSHQLYNDVFQQLESHTHTHTYHNNTNAANHVRIAISLPKWEALSASKILDLLPHNVNSSIIRRIQLQNHIVILCSIKLPCNSKNGRCFACARRTIKQKMGQSVLASQPINYLTALKTNKKCIRKMWFFIRLLPAIGYENNCIQQCVKTQSVQYFPYLDFIFLQYLQKQTGN